METTNRKKTDQGNTIREIQIGKYDSQKKEGTDIQFGRYKSENTNQEIQVEKYRSGKYNSGNTNRKILFENKVRKYKSENTNQKIQIGRYKSENTIRK